MRNSKNNSHLGRLKQKALDRKDKPVDNSEFNITTDPTGTSKCENRDSGNYFETYRDEENIKQDRFEESAQSARGADRVTRELSKQMFGTQQHNPGKPRKKAKYKKVREFFITRDKYEALEDQQRDPDYRPETFAKRRKRSKPEYRSRPPTMVGTRSLFRSQSKVTVITACPLRNPSVQCRWP